MKGGGGMDYPIDYPVKLLNIHTSSFDGFYSYPRHYQKFPQLYLVLEGKVFYEADGEELTLTGGSGVWVAPGCLRAPRAGSDSGRKLVGIFLARQELFPDSAGIRRITLDGSGRRDAAECADAVERGGSGAVIQLLFNRLCYTLEAALFEPPPPHDPRRGREESAVRALERIMGANLGNPLSFEELCRLAHLSQSSAGRSFRHRLGVSPMEHYRRMRLERGAELIRSGHCTVSEAAFATGFSSSQHFATAFRNCFGKTPTERN